MKTKFNFKYLLAAVAMLGINSAFASSDPSQVTSNVINSLKLGGNVIEAFFFLYFLWKSFTSFKDMGKDDGRGGDESGKAMKSFIINVCGLCLIAIIGMVTNGIFGSGTTKLNPNGGSFSSIQ